MSLILVKTKVGHGCRCRLRKNVSNFMIELACGGTIPMHHGSDRPSFLRLFLGSDLLPRFAEGLTSAPHSSQISEMDEIGIKVPK